MHNGTPLPYRIQRHQFPLDLGGLLDGKHPNVAKMFRLDTAPLHTLGREKLGNNPVIVLCTIRAKDER